MSEDKHPPCVLCVHFFVTWDRNLPRGCRAFAIKSHAYPSTLVEQESGEPCHAYQRRQLPVRATTPS